VLDLAIVFMAFTLSLLVVSVRSFGRALEARRAEAERIRFK
jgi:hypothetical protein